MKEVVILQKAISSITMYNFTNSNPSTIFLMQYLYHPLTVHAIEGHREMMCEVCLCKLLVFSWTLVFSFHFP